MVGAPTVEATTDVLTIRRRLEVELTGVEGLSSEVPHAHASIKMVMATKSGLPAVYAKVLPAPIGGQANLLSVRFTWLPPETERYLEAGGDPAN